MSDATEDTSAPAAMITVAQLALRLGVAETWIRSNMPRLPHYKFGRFYRFSPEDVEAILAMHHKTPPPPPPTPAPGALIPVGRRRRRT